MVKFSVYLNRLVFVMTFSILYVRFSVDDVLKYFRTIINLSSAELVQRVVKISSISSGKGYL